ncbi:MAG: putative PEP-binding protein [Planctomycetota bacterium]
MPEDPRAPEPPSPAADRGGEPPPAPAVATGETPPAAAPRPGGPLLRGATVCPGLVLGPAHRKDYDLDRARTERVPLDEVDRELNRFRKALDDSRLQLVDLRSRLEGKVREDDARILDTHVTYLKDSVFIADVENLILNEQMRLEAAIAKVVGDFDRIFRLVRSETLRQSAVDLRDVGIRVLRNLESQAAEGSGEEPPNEYVLAAHELSIVDMFNLSNEHVKGIITREGGITGHAAIFARSMRIPTITGVDDVLDVVKEGDYLILDATEGTVRVNPDDVVRAQYAETLDRRAGQEEAGGVPEWAQRPCRTLDGIPIEVAASCGNLPEVEGILDLGMGSIGLYRTELLYLVDQAPPGREALIRHYGSVLAGARGAPVTFRLLNVDSSLAVPYLHPERERNPALGRVGVRVLLANELVLRRQLQAILVAGAGRQVRIAVPFVTDCGELRRVKEVLFEERLELRKAGEAFQDAVEVGVVIETPAAMLGIRDLASEADFLLLNLDSLQQYLLAADRNEAAMVEFFETLHPFVLRALAKACEVAEGQGRPIAVFGVSAAQPANVPALIGAGLRRFCVAPAGLREFLDAVVAVDTRTAARAMRAAAQGSCPAETQSLVAGYRHGYARD